MKPQQQQRPGLSVIEVILALGMIVVIAAATSNLLGAIHRTNAASSQRAAALELARQQLDIVANNTTTLFVAHAPTCTPLAGYSSCWKSDPGVAASNPWHLAGSSGAWSLSPGTTTINGYTVRLDITNQASPADANIKTVTATVTWVGGGSGVSLTTELTSWKNVP